VARAAPDGYTLLLAVAGPQIIAPLLQKTGYHPIRDFVPVSNINSNPQVLLVHPSVQVASVRELISLARARPGKLNISTAGQGSLIELSALMFNHLARVEMAIVPYKGGAVATAAAMSGEVEATFANPSDAIPQVKAGKLRALGVTSAASFAPMPEVPTMNDAVPGLVVETWNGILAPAGTPAEIVNRLSGIVQDLARDPAMRQRMLDMGSSPIGDTPEQFRAFLEQQHGFWGRFVRDSGLKGAN
jgi:tripartite-type tricarboxylate transporter receptor subunit TctC